MQTTLDFNSPPKTCRQLVTELKAAAQDFEWYPTTNEILNIIASDWKQEESYRSRGHNRKGILDIGAGNGKALLFFKEHCGIETLLAIERSPILLETLPEEIKIAGTQFFEQSLITKNVSIIFCNPPYSEYEAWAEKIILESNAFINYLVIPRRWENSEKIQSALKVRNYKIEILGEYDFEASEDRQARAHIHILKIQETSKTEDPFHLQFQEIFKDLEYKFDSLHTDTEKDTRSKTFQSLVLGETYPETLVNLYREELRSIQNSYQVLSTLDPRVLFECKIDLKMIQKLLQNRLSDLKNTYWQELFNRITTITNRLCTKPRKNLLGLLGEQTHIDFTVTNIQAILTWIIKHANQYLDGQLEEVFLHLSNQESIQNYKSNHILFNQGRFRYDRDHTHSHYKLDYRIVVEHWGGIQTGSYSWERGISEYTADHIRDILTIAYNLGFQTNTQPENLSKKEDWTSGKEELFYATDKNKKEIVLLRAKGFKKGTLHFQFHQSFMLALNVEMGRIKRWIHTPTEADKEMEVETATEHFGSYKPFKQSDVLQLTA
jgi:hypothetical protein